MCKYSWAKEFHNLYRKIQKKKKKKKKYIYIYIKNLVILLKYISLKLLQNNVLKELIMINQKSFAQELYSILTINILKLVQN